MPLFLLFVTVLLLTLRGNTVDVEELGLMNFLFSSLNVPKDTAINLTHLSEKMDKLMSLLKVYMKPLSQTKRSNKLF